MGPSEGPRRRVSITVGVPGVTSDGAPGGGAFRMERRRKFGTPRRRVALLCAAAAAVTAHGPAGRRAGAGAGQEDLDLHRHDRVPSHRRHQRRPAGHPVAPRRARLHGRLGGLQQPRDAGGQPPADALQPPEPEPADLHGREPRAVRRDRLPEQLVVVGRRRRRRDRPAARGHAEGRARSATCRTAAASPRSTT